MIGLGSDKKQTFFSPFSCLDFLQKRARVISQNQICYSIKKEKGRVNVRSQKNPKLKVDIHFTPPTATVHRLLPQCCAKTPPETSFSEAEDICSLNRSWCQRLSNTSQSPTKQAARLNFSQLKGCWTLVMLMIIHKIEIDLVFEQFVSMRRGCPKSVLIEQDHNQN